MRILISGSPDRRLNVWEIPQVVRRANQRGAGMLDESESFQENVPLFTFAVNDEVLCCRVHGTVAAAGTVSGSVSLFDVIAGARIKQVSR